MIKEIELQLSPSDAFDEPVIRKRLAKKLRVELSEISDVQMLRRSIDARGRSPVYKIRYKVAISDSFEANTPWRQKLKDVSGNPKILVVGAGPAGLFAALELIEQGLQPIVLDRGKDVRQRRKDLRAIQQFGTVNPDSNYCFGEGGAGTYSDGKLYTRSHKRGSIEKTLKILVEHGAKTDIQVDAHPHIGSNKLPQIVANLRETILACGGKVLFEHKVTDFILTDGVMTGVIVNETQEITAEAVILATGHSARDIYHLCLKNNIEIEAKPFALGVRIEHPQGLIDEIQYRQKDRHPNLPASSYRLVSQVKGRGVFSFCMCPGGLIVPAATAPGELVVNGMSLSRRDSPFANSGTVVSVELEDLAPFSKEGVLAGLAFQQSAEQNIFQKGDGSQAAPAQRLPDFVAGKLSKNLPKSSYIPGVYAGMLHEWLPASIAERLRVGVKDFGKKMKGYFTEEAQVIGIESRTSSPVRIPRDRSTYMHEGVTALFPCGEGAGYAGGILSAAMDGQNVAKAVKAFVDSN